jgi:hypothetical protein
MLVITLEEVERQLLVAKPWKTPGKDGLPAIIWKMTWHVVKHRVLELFQASLEEGTLPKQWRHAKIIPLKKPNKENYTIAKAWRPISLLATLGNILESVVAERISHAVEKYGLPQNVGRHSKRVDAALPGKHTRQVVWSIILERSERAGPTPDWHGKT